MSPDEEKIIKDEIKKAHWIKFNDFEPKDHTFPSSVPTLVKMIESKGHRTAPDAMRIHAFEPNLEIIFDNHRFIYSKKNNLVYRLPIRDVWVKKGAP